MFTRQNLFKIIIFFILLPLLIPLCYLAFFIVFHLQEVEITAAVISKIWFSLWQSVATVLLSLFIGGGLAWIHYYGRLKKSPFFDLIMTLPIFLPTVVVAVGFIAVWGNAGYVNQLLTYLNLKPKQFLYSPIAIIIGHCFYNIPLAYLAISNRLSTMRQHLEETATTMGANQWQIFKTITFPRIKTACLFIGILIFIYSFLSFALPLILGDIQYQTLEVYIFNLITQQFKFATAAALAFGQLIFLSLIIIFAIKYFININEEHVNIAREDQKNIFIFYIVWFIKFILLLFILAPIIGLIIQGLNLNGLTMLSKTSFWPALVRTLLLALASILLNIITISLILLNHWQRNSSGRTKTKQRRWPLVIIAVSPIMLGLAWLLIFTKSLFLMILAYNILLLPLSYYLITSVWLNRPTHFIDTLKILGANQKQLYCAAFRYLWPTICKITALNFVFILGDISVSSILAPRLKPTAMNLSYNLIGSYKFNAAATGMSVILISIIIITSLIYLLKSYGFKNTKFNS